MKIRILLLFASAFYTACNRNDAASVVFPEQVAEWHLQDSDSTAGTAKYRGTPDIQVHLTRMSSTTTAFSAVQSWHAEAGKLAFYKGQIFGIAEGTEAPQRTLNRFVAAFEKTLPD
jgi:hypothetical protein